MHPEAPLAKVCSMDCDRTRLGPLYAMAEYVVHGPEGPIVLKPSEQNAALERLLAACEAQSLSCISAFNPQSHALSDEQNRRRQAALEAFARRKGWRAFPGVNRDPKGEWPDEQTLCLLDLPENTARALARCFGQCAILRAVRGRAPRLMWCDDEGAGESD